MTKGQLFTLLFAFTLRHCCTKAAICDLIALFNAILPGFVPHTLYYFRKLLSNGDVNDVETHVYCSKCGSYLSNANGNCDMVMCNECESVVSVRDMVKNGCTFLLFPLKSQLQTLFEKMCLWEHMNVNNCDIADGTEYKKLNINCPHSLSLTCNADGIPVFSSSNTTLWPVYFIINELPLRLRHIHMMLNASREWTHCSLQSLPLLKICIMWVLIGLRKLSFLTPKFTCASSLWTVLHVHHCKI